MGTVRRAVAAVLVAVAAAALTTVGVAEGQERPPGPRVLFFGDSLAGGTGAVPRRPVLPRTVASVLGWDVHVDAYGGTGYTTGGRHGRPYLQRLQERGVLSHPYDVVVLEGGTNDARHPVAPARLRPDVEQVLALVRAREPRARIVLVGVYAVPGERDPAYARTDAVLAQVARERGLLFASPLSGGWTAGAGPAFLSPDRFHPSAAGYALLGADLAEAIRRSGR